ncbi:unnamed protein product [Rotaria magnacalcarata]|uniref:glutathione transferase n=1 Tax=Rotaria magnacalcarata TaxID=392030 RepID=A0A816VM81_9BILA|nr:unnamed protein product [Rotaria magnacalcarata]CAF2125489.1 unnamed protein product [Rotaria magnacalcarata]
MGNKPQIILYGLATSTCTQRVIATLAEKQLNFKLTSIDVAGGEHKMVFKFMVRSFVFFKILIIAQLKLTILFIESRAICRYLELKYTGKGTELIPTKDGKAQGLFERFLNIFVYSKKVSTL